MVRIGVGGKHGEIPQLCERVRVAHHPALLKLAFGVWVRPVDVNGCDRGGGVIERLVTA